MSNSASYELQGAIVTLLRADAGVKALIGERFYDGAPANVTFDYGQWGPDQELPDEADCIDGSEVYVTLEAWTRGPSRRPNAKKILHAYRAAVLGASWALASHTVVDVEIGGAGATVTQDPDGLSAHGRLVFRFLTEPKE